MSPPGACRTASAAGLAAIHFRPGLRTGSREHSSPRPSMEQSCCEPLKSSNSGQRCRPDLEISNGEWLRRVPLKQPNLPVFCAAYEFFCGAKAGGGEFGGKLICCTKWEGGRRGRLCLTSLARKARPR